MAIHERPAVSLTAEPLSLDQARAALAAEWHERTPSSPAEIAEFYRTNRGQAHDLDAWHRTPERLSWTQMLVHVARESGAKFVVDIGCGAGHDLLTLLDQFPEIGVAGIEPNDALRDGIVFALAQRNAYGRAWVSASVEDAAPDIDRADLLVCVDVLEHVPNPEVFLGGIAERAPVGCLLFEAVATHDTSTPLHLAENRGWHPGRVLERHGWRIVDEAQGRIRVWKRLAETGPQAASLLICSYRELSMQTHSRITRTLLNSNGHWRERDKTGDADIGRSRAIITTSWWRETADDVFLMIDSDIGFSAADADRLAELCRNGYDIICGAYPVHNGQHLAMRCLPGTGLLDFGPGQPPLEILYAATGFMAVHRRVIDALVKTLPLCHANEAWSFYPLFPFPVVNDDPEIGWERLSEDYGFSRLARDAGFKVWLDPSVILSHRSSLDVTVRNMGLVYEASQKA